MIEKRAGIGYALAAAVLFGASTPLIKTFGGTESPVLLAGLLYLGSGVGLSVLRLARRAGSNTEAPLRRPDLPWMAGSVFFGGVCGPVLLMAGLALTTAATASLLLNLEGAFTALLAWVAFREHASRRTVLGTIAILSGGLLLSWYGSASASSVAGPILIAGACLAWAIDNNFTRGISASDPLQIASIKNLVAGTCNTVLAATALHAAFPAWGLIAKASAVGFLGYGVSLVLFLLALRHLGTARTSAYFSTAPFIGVGLALAMGSGSFDLRFALAAVLMGAGVWMHAIEHHEHEHTHDALEHEHAHVHDEHHVHAHTPSDPPGEPHTHRHRHALLTHAHPHFPDLHHRHGHSS